MIKTCIIGASGYTGAELVKILALHPEFTVAQLYVSQGSSDAGQQISDCHPQLLQICDLPLQPINDALIAQIAWDMDAIFLATLHEASHEWMSQLAGKRAVVYDLSGAFRLKDKNVFAQYYGFAHTCDAWRDAAVYGLAEWYPQEIADASLIAVPGCYPTASLSGLKPLAEAGLLSQTRPVINAISGVSGAGRKASLTNSYCEVSLQAYGILGHRHQPEIEAFLGQPVIFTPHLGNFKRGILATITAQLAPNTTLAQIDQAFNDAYRDSVCIRLRNRAPKVDDVVNTPYCDIYYQYDANAQYIVVTTAIDNVLKGAAAQAVQCANLQHNFPIHTGLVATSPEQCFI